MKRKVDKAVAFFKKDEVYTKLFAAFRKKYESLGRVGGSVSIKRYSVQEVESLARFFGKHEQEMMDKGTVTLRQFERELARTWIGEVQLKELLEAYFGEKLISNKEREVQLVLKRNDMLEKYEVDYPAIAFWFRYLREHQQMGRSFIRRMEENPDLFTREIEWMERAFRHLPKDAERLPLFSQRITGDPHAFDLQLSLGKMWIHLLSVHQALQTNDVENFYLPNSTEDMNRLLESYGIFRDDILNFVTCVNLVGETEHGVHRLWEVAAEMQSIQLVTLRGLTKLLHARPVKGNCVWIVENSGVYATLHDHVGEAPIICTNGQFTLAALMLLDLLIKADTQLYYAGDFDPEGLRMAQRLIDRYGRKLTLWRMDVTTYESALSEKPLSMERLESLQQIEDVTLLEVAEKMKQVKCAGYQEAVVTEMIEDLSRWKSKAL